MGFSQKNMEELYRKVKQLYESDPVFAEKAKKDIVATIKEYLGIDIPKNYELKYVEKDGSFGNVYLVPAFANDELELNELGQVAGGFCLSNVCAELKCAVDTCEAYNPCYADFCLSKTLCDVDTCMLDTCAAFGCGWDVEEPECAANVG